MSEFHYAADASSLPVGHGRTVHVRGRELALYNVNGSFHAMDDRCPHRGGSLGAGSLEGEEVYCPLHGWGFNARTGYCSTRPDRPVKVYPTRLVDGHVLVCLEPLETPATPQPAPADDN